VIRLLHFSDLHLGVENYGRLDPETGLSTRLMDFLRAFDYVVDFAIEKDIDLVLFTGDAFKNRDPSPTHQREFARRIRRLSQARVPTFLLVGNHDLPNALNRAHSVEIFDTLAIDHVTVAQKPQLQSIPTKRGAVQIAAMPWVLRSYLLTKDEFRGLTAAQVNDEIEARLRQILDALAKRVDDDVPAVLAFHGTVEGAVYGSERNVLLGQDIVVERALLANPKFDYIALGHIHKHQALPTLVDHPPMVYAGSIERIDFGEAREPKGFVVVEIGDGPTRWTFEETPTRPFLSIAVDTRSSTDPLNEVRRAIAKHEIADAVVKLVVKTTPEAAVGLHDRELRELLASAAHVAAIVREVDRPARLRLGDQETVAAMSPRELLVRYLEVKQVPPERARVLLEHADMLWEEQVEG